ncbi:MAG: AMP-binding protein [Bacteroidales bacterium]|nr:AMP-binding protein [Bacteroidales bacterium]
MNKSYTSYLRDAFTQHWQLMALTDYPGIQLKYNEAAQKIASLHVLFRDLGIKPGDKIALCGKNCSYWAVCFIAITTYGAVAVPLLHEFTPDNIQKISTHSESRLLFVSDKIFKDLQPEQMSTIEVIVTIDDLKIVYGKVVNVEILSQEWEEHSKDIFTDAFTSEAFCSKFYEYDAEDMLILNYTSGTTSNPKGVMIPTRAISSNIEFAFDHLPMIKPGDNLVSVLPMAHAYGMAFEFLYMFSHGANIHFLTKPLYPNYILASFKEVRPRLIILVPLIIEKIVRKGVFPQLEKLSIKTMLALPVLRGMVQSKLRQKLMETMGGNFYEIVAGGAAMSRDVEDFLREIKFPFTVGYGMTECAPLIGYADWKEARPGSCGKAVDRMEVKIDSTDPANVAGEILTRGEHVMLGYYKKEEETRAVIDADGWLHTGDMGVMDKDGFIYIKGRCKTMFLGQNGQNIYPEDIESLLNANPYIAEAIVVQREGKLVALVYPDFMNRSISAVRNDPAAIERIIDKQRPSINKNLPQYEQVARFEIVEKEFEKTPKKSIKRFLYK